MELFGRLLFPNDKFLRVSLEHGIEYLSMKRCIRDTVTNNVTVLVFTKLINEVHIEVEIKLEECNGEHGFYEFSDLTHGIKLKLNKNSKENPEYVSCLVTGITDTTFKDTTRAKILKHRRKVCILGIESYNNK